jgi:hypothetical protein
MFLRQYTPKALLLVKSKACAFKGRKYTLNNLLRITLQFGLHPYQVPHLRVLFLRPR